MMGSQVRFNISDVAWSVISGSEIVISAESYDGGSQGAHDALTALTTMPVRRAGKGRTHICTATREGAATIEDYCRTVGESFSFVGSGDDPETARDGRALLVVADRIAALLAR